MEIVGLQINNFKCFSKEAVGFQGLQKINLYVGKNNSGKSSLLEALHFLFQGNTQDFKNNPNKLRDLTYMGETNVSMHVTLTCSLELPELKKFFPDSTRTNDVNHWENAGAQFVKLPIYLKINLTEVIMGKGEEALVAIDYPGPTLERLKKLPGSWEIKKQVIDKVAKPLWRQIRETYTTVFVPATRTISETSPASGDPTVILNNDGSNLPVLAEHVLNNTGQDHRMVEENLKNYLVKIFPELTKNVRIRVKKTQGSAWLQLHLEEPNKPSLPVSNYGGGLRTIMVLMAHLLFATQSSSKKIIYLIEEPENGLHPELQRKLLNFYKSFFNVHHHVAMIATHSPSFIDWSGDTGLFQVVKTSFDSRMTSIVKGIDNSQALNVIRDLGFAPSHILQADLVIYVEGPSDSKALGAILNTSGLNTGDKNISILFLGGENIRHVDVEMLKKINPNVIFFLDSDKDSPGDTKNPSQWKKDLEKDCQKQGIKCIIPSDFREIENIFPVEVVSQFFNDPKISFGPFDDLQKIVPNYSKRKHTPAIAARLTETQIKNIGPFSDLLSEVIRVLNTNG